jgi:hypothetical protein
MSGVGVIARVGTSFSEITESKKRQPLLIIGDRFGWCCSSCFVLFILYMFAHTHAADWDEAPSK